MKTNYTISQLLNTVDKTTLSNLKGMNDIILCFKLERCEMRYLNYYTGIRDAIVRLFIDEDEYVSRGTVNCYIDDINKLVNKKYIFLRVETYRDEIYNIIKSTIKGEC